MNKYEKNYIKMMKKTQLSCCKSCTLDEVLSDDFCALSYECLRCEDRYKTIYNTNPEYDLETLFEIERNNLIVKYSEELNNENKGFQEFRGL